MHRGVEVRFGHIRHYDNLLGTLNTILCIVPRSDHMPPINRHILTICIRRDTYIRTGEYGHLICIRNSIRTSKVRSMNIGDLPSPIMRCQAVYIEKADQQEYKDYG